MFHADFYNIFSKNIFLNAPINNIFTLEETDKQAKLQLVNLEVSENCKLLKVDPDAKAVILDKIFHPPKEKNEQIFGNIFGKKCCDYILWDSNYTYFIELKSKRERKDCVEKFLATQCFIEYLQIIDCNIRQLYFNESYVSQNIIPVFIVFQTPDRLAPPDWDDRHLYENSHYLHGRTSSKKINNSLYNLGNNAVDIVNTPTKPHFITVLNGSKHPYKIENIKNVIIAQHQHHVSSENLTNVLLEHKPKY